MKKRKVVDKGAGMASRALTGGGAGMAACALPAAEAAKVAANKAPVMTGVFLRFPRAMTAVAKCSAFSAEKYHKPVGSLDYLEASRDVRADALGRHLIAEALEGGPDAVNVEYAGADPVYHAAQVAWGSLARLERMLRDKARAGDPKLADMLQRDTEEE